MSTATDTYLLLRAFVDELARCGLRAACTSPGSRCTPIVLSLAREQRLTCYSHIDERASGFFALGLAKATALPVAVTCTSGTAAAELLPAVIEAREARVPLLILTADRPPELREIGAGQAIDQLGLYGTAAKWFFEVGTHEATPERLRWMRTLACRTFWTAREGRPGAVHLNFPLREPLILDGELPADPSGRPDSRPYVSRPRSTSSSASASPGTPDALGGLGDALGGLALDGLVRGAQRGLLIAGRHERDTPLGEAVERFATAVGWPVLADPLSGARRGPTAIAYYDALLREQQLSASLTPDLVIRVGDLPTSKPLRGWLAGLTDVPQVALDPEGAWQDPGSVVSHSLALEPVHTLDELTDALGRSVDELPDPLAEPAQGQGLRSDPDWLPRWRELDELAAGALTGALSGPALSEPLVAAELGRLLAPGSTLFVSSSMPVRDIESFWPVLERPPRVLCNRGANGIDGVLSSAFGAAAGSSGPVVLLIGDVALAYDIGGLLAAGRLELKLTIVLIDNGGGGIFDFLPVSGASMAREPREPAGPDDDDLYTRHIATPTGLDFAQAASLYGLTHERVRDVYELRAALERALAQPGSGIIEIKTERAGNVEAHRRAWRAVSDELSRA